MMTAICRLVSVVFIKKKDASGETQRTGLSFCRKSVTNQGCESVESTDE